MIPYFIVLIIATALSMIVRNNKQNSRLFTFPMLLVMALLIAFASVRNSTVGTDSNNYVGIYNYFLSDIDQGLSMKTNIELGYIYIQYMASFISVDYWALFFCISLITVLCFFYVIGKLSVNLALSVFIFITLGTYLISFNAARQGIAVAISTIALLSVMQRKMWSYFIIIIIASFFHRTVLIMLPFYFILRMPFSYKNSVIFLIVGSLGFYFLSTVLSVFDSAVEERYSVYEDRGATGGYLLAVFFIVLTIFLVYARKFISIIDIKVYDVYLNYTIFTAVIYIVVAVTGSDVNFIRLTNYFAIGYILIFPLLFKKGSYFNVGFEKPIFILLCLAFFTVYLSKMANLSPYILNNNY